jgi:predicted negative regulator of RcsB-dependent stress response
MESDAAQGALFFKFWKWADAQKKPILWGGIIAVVVLIAVGLFAWNRLNTEKKASEALSKVTLRTQGQPPSSAQDVLKVASDYAGTDAGGRALLLAGERLFAGGKYAEAKDQFDKFLRDHKESAFAGQAMYGVAASLAAQNKTNEAIAAFKNIVDRQPNETVAMQAKLSLARLYESSGKLEQARDLYKELARPDLGMLGSEANMRFEDLISAHPNLIPAPETSTNAPVNNIK